MMSVNVSLVLKVCYLPNICTLFIIAFTSRPSTSIKHLQFYTLTLVFLNSSLNPVIYCWKTKHIRHTIIGLIRNAYLRSKTIQSFKTIHLEIIYDMKNNNNNNNNNKQQTITNVKSSYVKLTIKRYNRITIKMNNRDCCSSR